MSNEHIEYLKEQEKSAENNSNIERYMGGAVAITMGVLFLIAINFGIAFSQLWPIFFLFPVVFGGYQIVQDINAGRDRKSVV